MRPYKKMGVAYKKNGVAHFHTCLRSLNAVFARRLRACMGSLLHQILQCFSLTGRRQVLVAMPSFHAVALLLAALVFTSQHGTFAQCDLQPTISTSGEDGTSNYNDADLVGVGS